MPTYSTYRRRDFIVLTVIGTMLLTSYFATYNIISTITHEKHQDITIMKSSGCAVVRCDGSSS